MDGHLARRRYDVSVLKMNFGGFLGWWVWLFIHIGFLTGWRNRVGALLGWWFAFTRDIRRERTFTIDDIPLTAGAYSEPGGAASSGRPGATLDHALDHPSPAGTDRAVVCSHYARYDQFFAVSSRWGDVAEDRKMDREGSTGRSKGSGTSGEVEPTSQPVCKRLIPAARATINCLEGRQRGVWSHAGHLAAIGEGHPQGHDDPL